MLKRPLLCGVLLFTIGEIIGTGKYMAMGLGMVLGVLLYLGVNIRQKKQEIMPSFYLWLGISLVLGVLNGARLQVPDSFLQYVEEYTQSGEKLSCELMGSVKRVEEQGEKQVLLVSAAHFRGEGLKEYEGLDGFEGQNRPDGIYDLERRNGSAGLSALEMKRSSERLYDWKVRSGLIELFDFGGQRDFVVPGDFEISDDLGAREYDTWVAVKKKDIRIYVKQTEPELRIGDVIHCNLQLVLPSKPTNPGEFDSRTYYYSRGIMLIGYADSYELLDSGHAGFLNQIMKWKTEAQKAYDAALSEEHAGVMKAMILGSTSDLDLELRELYQRNGIAHILAISALHISILGAFLYKLLRRLGIGIVLSGLPVMIVLVLYGWMTGFSGSTIRAIIMFLLLLFGDMIGRTYDMLTAMAIACLYMLIEYPIRIFDAGFQLSFGAVFCLGFVVPGCQELWKELQNEDGNREGLKTVFWGKYGAKMGRKISERIRGILRRDWIPGRDWSCWKPWRFEKVWGHWKQNQKKTQSRKKTQNQKKTKKIVKKLQEKKLMWRKTVFSGIILQIVTAPIIIHYYYTFPIYGFLLNLIVIPLMTPLLVCGILGVLVFPIWRIGGSMLLQPCGWILSIYDWLCEHMERLPYAILTIGAMPAWRMVLYYIMLFMIYLLVQISSSHCARREMGHHIMKLDTSNMGSARYRIRRLVPFVIAGYFLVLAMTNYHGLQITMLDIGQGDSILCKTPDNQIILVDGGSSSRSSIGKYVITPAVRYYGSDHIDYVFVSHMDRDHVNGIEELIALSGKRGIRLRNLVLPYIAKEDPSFSELISQAVDAGIPIIYLEQYEEIAVLDNIKLQCIYPENEWRSFVDKNNNSMVLSLNYDEFNMLFTGDLEAEGEGRLLEQAVLKSYDVLKVGHHGSAGASSMDFLDIIHPQIAILSCGRGNRYGHPHEETLDRLTSIESHIYRTDQQGAILLKVKKGKVKVSYMFML